MEVTMTVNGDQVTRDVEPRLLLVHFLRDTLDLTGTHWGCDTSNCGACVVQVDGQPVKSCTMLAVMCDGHEVRTVEALEVDGVLDPIQQGFHERHALQCGFCTPGILMAAEDLLAREPRATREQITDMLSGQLCRCTGYTAIVDAIAEIAGS
jgi:carbon-monoxide dehydrogenase small subunit